MQHKASSPRESRDKEGPNTHLDLGLNLANLRLHADAVHHPDAGARRNAGARKQHALLGLQGA